MYNYRTSINYYRRLKSGKTGVEATTLAFQSVFGTAGSMILGIAIILFAYSTILGWSYYGENV